MNRPVPIALVGVGKICRDQHIPAIRAGKDFEIAATVDIGRGLPDVANFAAIPEMLRAHPEIRAVSICTPPAGRLALVDAAAKAGLAILIEKPPAGSLGEAQAAVRRAAQAGAPLYTAWHSRAATGVAFAKSWLDGRSIDRVTVNWREDVRVWHPGQEWIWSPGVGVFDPAINAISILSHLLEQPILVASGRLDFPSNRTAPIAAELTLTSGQIPISMALDFDQRGEQTWRIDFDAAGEQLTLDAGGSSVRVNGVAVPVAETPEYVSIYSKFAEVAASGNPDVDLEPLRVVTDAFTVCLRREVAPFSWT